MNRKHRRADEKHGGNPFHFADSISSAIGGQTLSRAKMRGGKRRAEERGEPGGWGAPTGCGSQAMRLTAVAHAKIARALSMAYYPAARWGHRALPPLPTRITRGHAARALPSRRATRAAQWSAAGPPGSRPTAIVLAHYPPFAAVRSRLPLRPLNSREHCSPCLVSTDMGISQDNWGRSCHGRDGLV